MLVRQEFWKPLHAYEVATFFGNSINYLYKYGSLQFTSLSEYP